MQKNMGVFYLPEAALSPSIETCPGEKAACSDDYEDGGNILGSAFLILEKEKKRSQVGRTKRSCRCSCRPQGSGEAFGGAARPGVKKRTFFISSLEGGERPLNFKHEEQRLGAPCRSTSQHGWRVYTSEHDRKEHGKEGVADVALQEEVKDLKGENEGKKERE